MSPRASAAKALLYVSDLGTFTVHVYEYPSLKAAGKLTGFDGPQGLCADSAGDVWVANTQSSEMREYAHGGTAPIATLRDAFGYPVGCAVNPSTGDLAVTNLENFSGAGIVLLYKHARGTPAAYESKSIYSYYFAGYDGSGNLYVSGASSQHLFALGVLARGANSIALVAVSGGTIYFPGTVAWSGSKLVLGDQQCRDSASSCLYRLTVAGTKARIVGRTTLAGACDVAEAWVGKSRVAAGDYESCSRKPSGVALWRYPAGGSPTARVTGLRQPVGAVLSTAGSR